MKSIAEIKNKIKLNHPCEYCKEIIYIGDGTIIEGKPLHFKCYKKKALLSQLEEIKGEIESFGENKCGWCDGFCPRIDKQEFLAIIEGKADLQELNGSETGSSTSRHATGSVMSEKK